MADTTTNCDRRLSRAARFLVHQVIVSAPELESFEANVLLDQALLHANSDCPLLHDGLRSQEEGVTITPAYNLGRMDLLGSKNGQKGSSSGETKIWFECGECKKKFVSRFYLDLHMDTHHAIDLDFTDCPAQSWCNFLGRSTCLDKALELEGTYGRGALLQGNSIRRNLLREANAEPCQIDHMKIVRQRCVEVSGKCFDSSLQEHWNVHFCNRLTCKSRLQRLIQIETSSDLKGQSWWGILAILSLVMGYIALLLSSGLTGELPTAAKSKIH